MPWALVHVLIGFLASSGAAQAQGLCSPNPSEIGGTIATFAGSGLTGLGNGGFGGDGGQATLAVLQYPFAVASGNGALYIADTYNHRVRKVDLTTCVISTVAGDGVSAGGTGNGGPALAAGVFNPVSVAVSGTDLFLSDSSGLRRVDLVSGIITAVGSGLYASGMTVADGFLYLANESAHRVWRVGLTSGAVELLAGSGTAGVSGDGGPALAASLNQPKDVAVANGQLYIADSFNRRIRVVDLATGLISTLAGFGAYGDTEGTQAYIAYMSPVGLELLGDALFFTDQYTDRVRAIDLASGLVGTIAGTGVRGFAGDDGPGLFALVDGARGLAAAGEGLFVADSSNHRVRRIELAAIQPLLTVQGLPRTAVAGSVLSLAAVGGAGTGSVSYVTSGPCTLSDGGLTVTLSGTSGECQVRALKAGDADYFPTLSAAARVAIGVPQPPIFVTGAPATASIGSIFGVILSGGVPGFGGFYLEASGACERVTDSLRWNGREAYGEVRMTRASGTCTLVGTLAGGGAYGPAVSDPVTIEATRAVQEPLVLTGVPHSGLPGTSFAVTLSGGSGTGLLRLTSAGQCTVSGATVTLGTEGTCLLTASRDGDAEYMAATLPSREVLVGIYQAPLAIVAPAYSMYGSSFPLAVEGGSGGGAISYGVTGPCELDGGALVTMTGGTGACTVTATKDGDSYYPATNAPAVIVQARRARQAPLAIAPLDTTAPYGSTLAVDVSGGSGGGAVTIEAFGGGCAALPDSSLVVMTSGSYECLIAATKSGDANLEPRGTQFSATSYFGSEVIASGTVDSLDTTAVGDLLRTPDGLIYGTVASGGALGYGVLFEANPVAGTVEVVHGFDGRTGAYPTPSLVLGHDGHVYGLAQGGGFGFTDQDPRGVLFKYDRATRTLTVLHRFANPPGSPTPFPEGGELGRLIQASDGVLYGTASSGGANGWHGTIFRFDPAAGSFAVVHAFSGTDGSAPMDVVEGPDGALYGSTRFGGAAGRGTLFRLTTSGTLTTLVTFTGSNGSVPANSLHMAADGTVHGTTSGGGPADRGSIFRLSPDHTFSPLYFFPSQADRPASGLMPLLDGRLYGFAGASLFAIDEAGAVAWLDNPPPVSHLLLTEDGWMIGGFGDTESGAIVISRVQRPASAVVYPEALQQAPVYLTGAPSAAENGSSFPVSVTGGTLFNAHVEVYANGACFVSAQEDATAWITMAEDEGDCELVGANYGDDNYQYTESEMVVVQALPASTSGMAPTIAWVAPSSGTSDGGDEVLIYGSHFQSDATVTFGGSPAASVTVEDEFSIRAITPPHPVATVDIVVGTSGDTLTATATGAFTFGPPPAIGLHGAVTRANYGQNGDTYDGPSNGALSADGNVVAFISTDDYVVEGDENGRSDVFLRDLQDATTEQVNLRNDGTPAAEGEVLAGPVYVSADGQLVAFSTTEALVPDDTNGKPDVYVRNRAAGTTTRVSVRSNGAQLAADTVLPGPLTGNGRYAAFVASGVGVTPTDTYPATDVFVRDLVAGTTSMISLTAAGTAAGSHSDSPAMSDDARFVAFVSPGTAFAEGGFPNVLLRDRDTDEDGLLDEPDAVATTLVSAAAPGVGGNQVSGRPSISADGRVIAFQSLATNFGIEDTNGVQDVFRFDRSTSVLARISVRPGGSETTAASSVAPHGGAVNENGQYVVFSSADTRLVPFDGNLAADVFRHDADTALIELVSARADGSRTDSSGSGIMPASLNPSINADGSRVVFASDAPNLVDDDGNGTRDLFIKELEVNTPEGDFVTTAPIDPETGGSPVLMTFSAVLTGGTTTLARLEVEDAPTLPEGFSAGVVYELDTTADLPVGATIEICISYGGLAVPNEGALRLTHFVDGEWVDITSYVDTDRDLVCGVTTSFSPFAIAVPTATSISVSASASSVGGTTILSATVTPAAPGTVTFFVNDGPTIEAEYDASSGVATAAGVVHALAASTLPYPVRAVFTSAATNVSGSEVIEAVLFVSPVQAQITFGPVPPVTYLGGHFTVTASTTNTDDGQLTLSVVSGPCLADVGGAFNTTGAGICVIRADGAATTNFGAASAELSVSIARAATVVELTSSPNPSTNGQPVTLLASVSAGGTAVVSGSVTFRDGATTIGTVALDQNGNATLSSTTLAPGARTITADFPGTDNFSDRSASIVHTVEATVEPYTFEGFFAPVDMPMAGTVVWNGAKAGQAIPVKWRLLSNGTPVAHATSFLGIYSYAVSCSNGAGTIEDAIEEYATGGNLLTYSGDGRWQYNWKTPKAYAGTCRVLFVRFSDGSDSPGANFKFK